ncbi:MAG: hypothetical protein R3F33_13485 [Planctomycetota bacterium]
MFFQPMGERGPWREDPAPYRPPRTELADTGLLWSLISAAMLFGAALFLFAKVRIVIEPGIWELTGTFEALLAAMSGVLLGLWLLQRRALIQEWSNDVRRWTLRAFWAGVLLAGLHVLHWIQVGHTIRDRHQSVWVAYGLLVTLHGLLCLVALGTQAWFCGPGRDADRRPAARSRVAPRLLRMWTFLAGAWIAVLVAVSV